MTLLCAHTAIPVLSLIFPAPPPLLGRGQCRGRGHLGSEVASHLGAFPLWLTQKMTILEKKILWCCSKVPKRCSKVAAQREGGWSHDAFYVFFISLKLLYYILWESTFGGKKNVAVWHWKKFCAVHTTYWHLRCQKYSLRVGKVVPQGWGGGTRTFLNTKK